MSVEKLTIPEQSDLADPTVELSPRRLERWLNALPLTDISSTARLLLDALRGLNRERVNPEIRFQLNEQYQQPVNLLIEMLMPHFLGQPIPLPERSQNIVDLLRDLCLELSTGYKILVVEGERRRTAWDSETIYSIAIYRALRYQSRALTMAYQAYAQVPEGVWREIHALYQIAQSHQVVGWLVEDRFSGVRMGVTVGRLYKACVLLGLADPQALMNHEVSKLFFYLEHAADLAHLRPLSEVGDSAGKYVVDLDSDHCGSPYSSEMKGGTSERYWLLDTLTLARRAEAQQAAIEDGHGANVGEPYTSFLSTDSLPMLRGLARGLGGRAMRRSERLYKQGRVQMCRGINAAHYFVNGGNSFVPPDMDFARSAEFVELKANIPKTVDTSSDGFEVDQWNRVNLSADGLALLRDSSSQLRISVGDVLGLRQDEGTWSIGIIRRANMKKGGQLLIGIQIVAFQSRPVSVRRLDRDSDGFSPALLLPKNSQSGQPVRLLTHAGICDEGTELLLTIGDETNRVKVSHLVEASGSYELLEFDLMSTGGASAG
ncbi:MAG: hypothetical protein J4A00_01930 [Gammaproteobacteria bacterium]|nr:hypothetical protein [Gammaproteobacteria bacterium]